MCSKVVLETISRQPNLQSFKIHQVDPQQDTGCTPNPLTDSNTFIMKKHTIKFGIWGWSFQPPQPHLWQFKAWAERTAGCFQQHCKKIHQVRLPSLNIVARWKIENGKPKRKLYEIVISLQAMWQKTCAVMSEHTSCCMSIWVSKYTKTCFWGVHQLWIHNTKDLRNNEKPTEKDGCIQKEDHLPYSSRFPWGQNPPRNRNPPLEQCRL